MSYPCYELSRYEMNGFRFLVISLIMPDLEVRLLVCPGLVARTNIYSEVFKLSLLGSLLRLNDYSRKGKYLCQVLVALLIKHLNRIWTSRRDSWWTEMLLDVTGLNFLSESIHVEKWV